MEPKVPQSSPLPILKGRGGCVIEEPFIGTFSRIATQDVLQGVFFKHTKDAKHSRPITGNSRDDCKTSQRSSTLGGVLPMQVA